MPTTDFIEDACDILDKGESDYVLITLEAGDVCVRVTSSMSRENALMFKKEIRLGGINESLEDHLANFYNI